MHDSSKVERQKMGTERVPAPRPSVTSASFAPSFPLSTEEETSGGILDYWRMLIRHKRTIWLFASLGVAAGIFAGISQPPRYHADSAVEVLDPNEDFMNTKQISAVTTHNASDDSSDEQTQALILESVHLLGRVYDELDPDANKQQPALALPAWRIWLHMPPQENLTPRERLLLNAEKSLKVKVVPKTRIIEVRVSSTDAQLATDYANTLVNDFVQENGDTRWQSTKSTSTWLASELSDARGKLQKSEAALQEYAGKSGLVFMKDDEQISDEKLKQIQEHLSAASVDRIAKEVRYQLARNAPSDSLPDVLDDAAYKEAKAKLDDLRRQVANLSATYTPEYGKTRRAMAEMAAMQAIVDRDRANILQRVQDDYNESVHKENMLVDAYKAQAQTVSADNQKAVQYNILKREADSNRQLYDLMLQQMKEASVASAMHASNVRVVDPAFVPRIPYSPDLRLNCPAGLFTGLLLGVLFVLIRERTDRTVRAPGEMQYWTSLPELAVVPNDPLQRRGRGLRSRPRAATGLSALAPDSNSLPVAESFRSLLTGILFAGEKERIVVFTSAEAGEGKTTIVSNLAAATARIGRRVLIIDADLRRPRMHEVFALSMQTGLADILRGPAFDEASARSMVQKTFIEGLHVLASGETNGTNSDLLYSSKLDKLLRTLRAQYDFVFVDTPPMLQTTDARLIARFSDGIVMIARAARTTREAFIAATQRLADDGINVLGAVLNDCDPRDVGTGQYAYFPSIRKPAAEYVRANASRA